MKVYKSLGEVRNWENRGLSLGVFDGLHLGHQAILKHLLQACEQRSLRPTVFTFVAPFGAEEKRCLFTLEDKLDGLEHLGIADVFVVEMSPSFRNMTADYFLNHILLRSLNVKLLVLGQDAHFGAGGEGDVNYLTEYSQNSSLDFQVVPDVIYGGKKISSSRIRHEIELGKVEEAAAMLGKSFKLRGRVEYGRSLGSRKGFPTANISYPQDCVRLKKGVYITTANTKKAKSAAISNVGVAPTIHEKTPMRIETYLYDFDDLLYGEEIEVEFHSFVRPEKKFASMAELTAQVRRDMNNVKEWHASHMIK